MDYNTILEQVVALLQREKRLSYRVLKRRLQLDDGTLEDLKEDLIYAKQLAVDEEGKVLVWTEAPGPPPGLETGAPPWPETKRAPAPDHPAAMRPIAYTPRHLAERILAEQAALEARGPPMASARPSPPCSPTSRAPWTCWRMWIRRTPAS
jgi:hypothetical protein